MAKSHQVMSLAQRLDQLEWCYQTITLSKKIAQGLMIAALTFMGSLLGSIIFSQLFYAAYVMAAVGCGVAWYVVLRANRHAVRGLSRQDWFKHFESQEHRLRAAGSDHGSLRMALTAENEQRSQALVHDYWHHLLHHEGEAVLNHARQRMRRWIYRVGVAVIVCLGLGGMFQHRVYENMQLSLAWLPAFKDQYVLKIVQGAVDARAPRSYQLSVSSPPTIALYDQNLLEIILQTPLKLGGLHSLSAVPSEHRIDLHGWFPEADLNGSAPGGAAYGVDRVKQTAREFSQQAAPLSMFMHRGESYLKEAYQAFIMTQAYQGQMSSAGAGSFDQSMSEHRNVNLVPDTPHQLSLAFRVSRNSAVVVPRISKRKPVAYIALGAPSVPEVGLLWNNASPTMTITDHEFISLKLSAVSPYPLVKLRLVIETEGGEYLETVTQILAADQLSIVHNFNTTLRAYITRDEQHVHLFGEAIAIDPADQQTEFIGRSEPLAVTVVSSYGRYLKTLAALKDARHKLMSWSELESASITADLDKLAMMIAAQSSQTPFFHFRDRRTLNNLVEQLKSNQLKDPVVRGELLVQLTEFLELHESMDQRARDRDFFVAARAYSQKLGQYVSSAVASMSPRSPRSPDLKQAGDQVADFLRERHQSWSQRVQKMSSISAEQAAAFQQAHREVLDDHYFVNSWMEIHQQVSARQEDTLGVDTAHHKERLLEAKSTLAQMVSEYARWIDQLESAEQALRDHQRLKHNQVLSQVAQDLRALRKSQDDISVQLDPLSHFTQSPHQSVPSDSSTGKKDQLGSTQNWSAIKSEQVATMTQGQELLKMLRQLQNFKGERLDQALRTMSQVVQAGDEHNYAEAELRSDQASRLLREGADQVRRRRANMNQQRRDDQARSQPHGDEFYGAAVLDFTNDEVHEVDKFYREDILQDVNSQSQSVEDQTLKSRYLREILR